jgi:hypothetical protein
LRQNGVGQRDGQQQQQQCADRQQKPLLELNAAAILLHRRQQVLHRRPSHLAETLAREEVDENGRCGSRQPAEHGQAGKLENREQRHGRTFAQAEPNSAPRGGPLSTVAEVAA